MKLDKRLLACARMTEGEYVCDVGTDHGYLPAYLILNGKCSFAIAADINPAPLAAAKATFEREGISDKVRLFLSDGLRDIPLEGITDIVIAGMGGELISRIMDCCEAKNCGANFILQPMTRAAALRKYLARSGFEVTCEKGVWDGSFVYSVMKCRFTGIPYELSPVREHTGLLDPSLEDDRRYILRQLERMERSAEGMQNSRPHEAEKIRRTLGLIRKETML